ncbi:SseB family protein [Virgisporangium ochraceum]|nr:SseB family protein [Virgisporangium ochraceum]
MITPDEPAEEEPAPTGRGIWDPKVPPVPAEPDEDFDSAPHQEVGSPGDSRSPSSDEEPAPSREPEPEPEPVNWNYADYPAANSTEEELLEATRNNTSNLMLSTLLLAKVLIPGYAADPAHWPAEEIRGTRYLVAFTSMQRLTAHYEATLPEPEPVRFTTVIAKWPSEEIGFALNPGTPMGRLLGGSEVRGLARSAAEFGLIDADALMATADAEEASAQTQAIPAEKKAPVKASEQPQLMQRTVAASQVSMYLERGYDRVCGFVHRAGELSHLSKPADLYRALGLAYPESPFSLDDTEVYVLRWPAHLLSLYRIPFGGQTEEALHAMQGWMIERAPFRGNGFAPSETGDVVAEFKIDSTRLPHGAQLWRLNSDGIETLVALFDADSTRWRRIGSAES